jgi:predicted AAA+ superfamily ATPase
MPNDLLPGSIQAARATLERRLAEAAPARLQLLVGPRQVGKTTLLLDLAKAWQGRGLYVAADAPASQLPGWRERIWAQACDLARQGPAALFLDEIQTQPGWSTWLKTCTDELHRARLSLHVVATGSSALHLASGSRESMAGRFERIGVAQWSAADLVAQLGVPASEAAQRIVSHGGYPGAVAYWPEPERWRAYLRDAIVEPAIGRDLMALEAVRKPALLRQVVALACGHPAEIWSLDKISGSLTDRGALETIAHYLDLLREACLVAPVQKYAGSTLRRRRAPPKLVVLDNALLVGAGDLQPPDPASDPTRWGRWVENACLAHAAKRGLAVTYWREEPWEADAVIEGEADGERGRWVVEVKTGAYGTSDLRGLAHAAAALPTHRPLVLCDPGREEPARQAGFTAVAWTEFLFDRW